MSSATAEFHVPPRRFIAFLAMGFGMFMAILDIQIVSASLAEIQAGLSASSDEISWVQTSYLIAEVVMIPLSGFLGRLLSTRVLFAVSAAGFTLASALCATATTIDEMIVYRAIQGFIGGGMIPSVFAAAFTVFPASRRPVVSPLIGLIATLAPTIGPTVGGYVSHALSWHWLFLLNVPPGILVAITTWSLIDFDEPEPGLLRRFDWLGLGAMAVFLGSLEYVLEEGARDDWFDSSLILALALVSAAAALVFFVHVLRRHEPIVDLKAFGDRNFALGSLFSAVLGVGLYGLTYVYPLYLAQIRGHDSLQIGETLFVSGLAMFATAPIAGRLASKVDPRLMVMTGFLGFALGTWIMTDVTVQWDFDQLLVPQILRGASLMLCIVTINNLALGTLPPAKLKNASGLYNLMRNLGGAIGLAIINTVLNDRTDLHLARLHSSVAWGRAAVADRLQTLQAAFAAHGLDGSRAAVAELAAIARRQAHVMSFADVFFLLTLLFVSLAFLAFTLHRPRRAAAGGH
ncbi:MFS transporter, DHA2 family, multidrug resistance protein [Tistlia consotensis]|uniref:MFS transporter, DHA2 family, multidrug resistance protein n=1 Tax=Tistlia consotensis USBA 355 TaxID=560819 RepID=A0A1Y6BNL1_9PROT|nr:DHA2 family efflux MFS transporter permease subunit [Tistlia consotensis]SMF12894.1 MFS transporter, DHA2 family, multidrug resistance protein [Tistlia consotensis USBA 355]SNR50841.1 MFS transporter, DHA2 family, multidrug resistance protein [Tistlia consotensis]